MIRFYLQSFLKFSIGIFLFYFGLNSKNIRKGSSIFNFMLQTALSIAIFLVVPYMFYKILMRHRRRLRSQEIQQKYGSLYLGIKTKQLGTVLHVFTFLTLRFLFVIFTFSLSKYPILLINLYIWLINFNMMYIICFKPYDTEAQNRIELANSFLLVVVAYNLLLLANLLPSAQLEYKVGWSIIVAIGMIFLVNMGYMMSLSLRQFFIKIYQWIKKRRLQQRILREQIAANQAIINAPSMIQSSMI